MCVCVFLSIYVDTTFDIECEMSGITRNLDIHEKYQINLTCARTHTRNSHSAQIINPTSDNSPENTALIMPEKKQ